MTLALVGDGLAIDHDQLASRALRARRWLGAHVRPGDIVALRPAVDVDTATWVAAALESDVTLLLQHPRMPEAELARQRDVAGARVVLPKAPLDGLDAPGGHEDAPLPPPASSATPLAIVFTSGTTGHPRGAVLSRRAFFAAAEASAANLGWRDDDRWLLSLPPAHVGGLSVLVRAFLARRTVVLGPPELDALPDVVLRHRVTLLSLVPTQLHRLLDRGWRPPSFVRAVLLGGAAASPSLLRRAREAGVPVLPTYGLTESCAQLATRALGDDRDAPDVGFPLRGMEVRVRAQVLEVRGPQLFDGYLGEPRPFDAEGWFSTGDLGSLDAEGRLTVLGRRGDLVVRGGENVYPARVESILVEDSSVRDAAVLGLPDEEWGERVAVALVTDDPEAARAAIARAPLAPFERPTRVAFFDALPTNATGKIDRATIRSTAVWRDV